MEILPLQIIEFPQVRIQDAAYRKPRDITNELLRLRTIVQNHIPEMVQKALGDAELADWFWDELERVVKQYAEKAGLTEETE